MEAQKQNQIESPNQKKNEKKLYKGTALFMKLVFSSCERVSLVYNLESASANSVY